MKVPALDTSTETASIPLDSRPEPKPGSRAHARTQMAERPDAAPEHVWERVAVYVGRAFKSSRATQQLRPLVTTLATEMRLQGADWIRIEDAVTSAVRKHPDFGVHDRLNVVSGKQTSDPIIERMLGWVELVRQREEEAVGTGASRS